MRRARYSKGARANIARALLAWKAPQDVVAEWQPEKRESAFVVYADNWPAVRLFVGLETQWRALPLSTLSGAELVHQGLDYNAVPIVAGAYGLALDEKLMRALQVMEAEALKGFSALRAQRAKDRKNKQAARQRH